MVQGKSDQGETRPSPVDAFALQVKTLAPVIAESESCSLAGVHTVQRYRKRERPKAKKKALI